jgi:hypothetical protein
MAFRLALRPTRIIPTEYPRHGSGASTCARYGFLA